MIVVSKEGMTAVKYELSEASLPHCEQLLQVTVIALLSCIILVSFLKAYLPRFGGVG